MIFSVLVQCCSVALCVPVCSIVCSDSEGVINNYKCRRVHLHCTHEYLELQYWPNLCVKMLVNPSVYKGNYNATSNNMYIGTARRDWAGSGCEPAQSFFAVPNVTAHTSTANVPITLFLYNGPLLCGSNVPRVNWVAFILLTSCHWAVSTNQVIVFSQLASTWFPLLKLLRTYWPLVALLWCRAAQTVDASQSLSCQHWPIKAHAQLWKCICWRS